MTIDDSSADSPDLSALLAEMTAVADGERERADKLVPALASTRTIGIALGLIMAEHNLTEAAAFQVLRKFSQQANRKVRDLASALIARHEEQVTGAPTEIQHG